MSLLKSWFQESSESRPSWVPLADSPNNGLLSPRPESTRSPSASSSPSHSRGPSTTTTTRRSRTTSSRSADPLLALERYESDIQRHLQSLLDAQSEGLLAGIGSQDVDTQSVSDAASSTGGARSTTPGKVIPIRQPTRKPLSLRAARRGIKSAMRELSAIKEQELEVYDRELLSNAETVSRVKAWDDRRKGLEKEVKEIQTSEGSSRAQELQREDSVLQEQITAMENQLMELKGQQNAVKLELSRIENSVQSKLSSYTASLNMLDKEASEFLARPPQHPSRISTANEVPYFSLPPARRTLEMALDHMQDEKQALEERQQNTQLEREAIEDGLVVWDDAAAAVTKFELTLRKSIQMLGAQRSTPENASSEAEATPGMEGLLEQMDLLVRDLDSKAKLAEARGWKLLVCCIGAELEALKQGRSILEQAQTQSNEAQEEQDEEIPEAVNEHVHADSYEESPVRRSTDSFRRRNDRPTPRAYRPEDDEPDPDLLISRQDTDTE